VTRDLTPPRGGARPTSSIRELAGVAVLAVAAALVFYSTLLFGGSLNGYDWASHHYNYFDWVRISLSEFGTLPLFMNDAWVTKNFWANAESPTLGPLTPLLLVLPTGAYIKLLLVVFTAAGFTGTYLLVRDLGVRREIAVFAGLVFAFQGFFVAHLCVGHPWAMGGQLLPGLLAGFRRAALGSRGALWGVAALNAVTILGGQHQPFIWQNLLLSIFALLWAVRVRSWFPLVRWGGVLLATAGLAAVKLLPLWAEFRDYAPTARVPGLPPSLLLTSLVAGGQNPESTFSVLDYRHGAGWWEYAFYLGPVAFAAVAVGVTLARRCWPLVAASGFFTVLSLEWAALDPWSWFEDLPVWRSQRGPSRFLFLALSGAIIASTLGLQRLWERNESLWPRATRGAAWLLTLAVAASLYAASLPWQRAGVGEALASADHRPRPLRLGTPGGVTAELIEFEPNRLVYRASAAAPGRVVFPFRWGVRSPEWHVAGLPTTSERGKLAVDLPAGERDLVMTYRPKYFRAGLAVSVLTLVGVCGGVLWPAIRARLRGQ
jgi:hypothetical protein